jgi:hypothetical protein
MRSSRCSILPLWMQRRFELDAPQRATRFSPTLGLESRTPRARKLLLPRTTPFRWVRETPPTNFRLPKARHTFVCRRWRKRAGRKSGAKINVACSRERARPSEACASRFFLFALRAPPVTGDACEMGWNPIRVLVHVRIVGHPDALARAGDKVFVLIALPRRRTPFRKPRCFSPWESNDRRDRSLNHSTGPLDDATGSRFCHRESPRLFFRRSSPGADGSKRGLSSARLVSSGFPIRPIAAP